MTTFFEILLVVSWVHGLLLVGVLLSRSRRNRANAFFVLLLLSVLWTQTMVTLDLAVRLPGPLWLFRSSFCAGMATSVLIFLYVTALLRPSALTPRLYTLSVAPFGIALVWYLLTSILFPTPRQILSDGFPKMVLEDFLRVGYVTAGFGIFLALAIRQLWTSRHDHSLNPRWLRFLLGSFAAIWVFLFASYIFALHGPQWLWVPVVHTLLVLGCGFFSLKHSSLFAEITTPEGEASRRGVTRTLDPVRWDARRQQLEGLMLQGKLFTRPGLKLPEVAEELGLRVQETSELINLGTGMSFYEYVNRHRVEEVKKRLHSGKFNHMSLLGIALDCGFNSKSVFNEAFKQFTGQTPSEYRKSLGESPVAEMSQR